MDSVKTDDLQLQKVKTTNDALEKEASVLSKRLKSCNNNIEAWKGKYTKLISTVNQVKDKQSKQVQFLKDKMKKSEETSKKDMTLMNQLNQRILHLNSRLQTVEERLVTANKEKDRLINDLKKCKKNSA
jgi:septal ring factor EnvC (AmiA/AmiB activator)